MSAENRTPKRMFEYPLKADRIHETATGSYCEIDDSKNRDGHKFGWVKYAVLIAIVVLEIIIVIAQGGPAIV